MIKSYDITLMSIIEWRACSGSSLSANKFASKKPEPEKQKSHMPLPSREEMGSGIRIFRKISITDIQALPATFTA
ncbi:hypothetical protein [Pseudomonas indica]|uniref:hypothetical protein n=1 Tax=Pseudomonas indica TaxID=137658 RepID=UPI003FD0E60D